MENNKEILKTKKHEIRILSYINLEVYEQIKSLETICCEQDEINLKLELEYKLHISRYADENENYVKTNMNEFLYYIGGELISYLGISCFDGITGEINGMTHPKWRGNGFFNRLLTLAADESQRAGYKKTLLLTDGNSRTGMRFLQSKGICLEHSEYRMKRMKGTYDLPIQNLQIVLRPACKKDEFEISRQNNIYFQDEMEKNETGKTIVMSLEEYPENTKIFMIELEGTIIGKINIEYSNDSAFIAGFGIYQDYRRKGYGKAALTETIRIIEADNIPESELDVVCTNSNALNLYKSCGFSEESVMNYYTMEA